MPTGSPARVYSHDVHIRKLREDAEEFREALHDQSDVFDENDRQAGEFAVVCVEAAIVLLETHDSTGINLTRFGAVGDFVNMILSARGLEPVQDNHV